MRQSKKTPVEIVVPRSTIFSEHPAVVIDKNVPAAKREMSMPSCNIFGVMKLKRALSIHLFIQLLTMP